MHARYSKRLVLKNLCPNTIGDPVKISVIVGNYKQPILYEGEGVLCKECGRLGHVAPNCSDSPKQIPTQNPMINEATTKEVSDEWTITTVSRWKKRSCNHQQTKDKGTSSSTQPIKVNLFDTVTSKFLETRDFLYKTLETANSSVNISKAKVRLKLARATLEKNIHGPNNSIPTNPKRNKKRPTPNGPS